MTDKKFVIILVLALMLVVSLFCNYKQYRDAQAQPEQIKVEVEKGTKTEIKEEKKVAPQPVSSKTEKKISVKKGNRKQKLELISKNEVNSDSISGINFEEEISETDSTYEVPITQKVYEDSSYTAYVSGFHANLDSITIRNKIITNTVRETITKTVTKKTWFGLGLQGGYYMTPAGLQPGIGIGISVNVWQK